MLKQLNDWISRRAAKGLEARMKAHEQRLLKRGGWRLREGESTAPGTRGHALLELAKRGCFTSHWVVEDGAGYWEYRLTDAGRVKPA